MYCIGLMSGTSVDGIDAVLVEITGQNENIQVNLINHCQKDYPKQLRQQIIEVCSGKSLSMAEFAKLDDDIAVEFATAAKNVQHPDYPAQIIGSHGQTVFHRPPTSSELGYSLQLGRGALIAHLTQLPTVNNFRAADIAAKGQGAPLVSKIDVCLLSHPEKTRCVQNLGGIGNVTYLLPQKDPNWLTNVKGWDTGPANVLVDLAIQRLTQGEQTYDNQGQWADKGMPCTELIDQWLKHPFFSNPPPKSTGRELFSPEYLDQCWKTAQAYHLSTEDWLATLTDFTAATIVDSYQRFLPNLPDEILLCGGGSHNLYLRKCLAYRLPSSTAILTTDDVGLSGDNKEAIAFAILAYWRFHCHFAGNLPSVTGAIADQQLGEIHLPLSLVGQNADIRN
ncbi:MAG: anhydro-N-acetylmuramic acid kinase [Microcystaceae cyanobacterium]